LHNNNDPSEQVKAREEKIGIDSKKRSFGNEIDKTSKKKGNVKNNEMWESNIVS
jgi:hypothetical protein